MAPQAAAQLDRPLIQPCRSYKETIQNIPRRQLCNICVVISEKKTKDYI
jgi:hypothetical protein